MTIIRTSKQCRPTCGSFFQQFIKTVAFGKRTGDVFQLAATSGHECGFLGICSPVTEHHAVKRDRFLVAEEIGSATVEGEFNATVSGRLDHLTFVYRISYPELAHGPVRTFGEHLTYNRGDFADDDV